MDSSSKISSPESFQQWKDQLKNSINIVEVIGEQVVLKKTGSTFSGLCPFHQERTPSFHVHEQKQFFHCYGCKKGGDVIQYVQESFGLSFVESIKELAHRARMKIPAQFRSLNDPVAAELAQLSSEKKDRAYKLNRFVLNHFQKNLRETPDVQSYLEKRGVDSETAAQFFLGYASVDTYSFLEKAKAPLELTQELGITSFKDRLIFPLIDLRAKVIGFGGRVLQKEEGPKFLNSKDSLLFQKSKALFGIFQAQKHIREEDCVLVVEGYLDVLVLHRAGFRHTVATCGTALTVDHLRLLNKLCSKIIVLFDPDRAGEDATKKALETGLQQGLVLHSIHLDPELGEDPDEFLWNGTEILADRVESLKEKIRDSKSIFKQELENIWKRSRKSPEDKTHALRETVRYLSMIPEADMRAVWMEEVSTRYGVDKKLILTRNALESSKGGTPIRVRPKGSIGATAEKIPEQKLTKRDQILLEGILVGGAYTAIFESVFLEYMSVFSHLKAARDFESVQNSKILFESMTARNLYEQLQVSKLSPEQVISFLVDPETRAWLTGFLTRLEGPPMESFKLAALQALQSAWAQISQLISQQISLQIQEESGGNEASPTSSKMKELSKEFLDVTRRMNDVNSFINKL